VEGHSLVEVLVAMLIIVTALLPAGYAVASGIRLGRKGDASARVALALMARASMVQQLAGATAPRCQALAAGSAGAADLREWWTASGVGAVRQVRLRARVLGAGWVVEDSLDLQVQCQ
jgi:Tfp pilus assembly protein PilV